MKKLHATLMVASLVGVTAFMGGCTTVQRGAAAGGALGATSGAIIGHNWKSTAAAGAAIGGGSGAAAGGLAGEAFTKTTRDDLNREMENMRAELQSTERELASLRAAGISPESAGDLDRLQRELAATRSELDRSRGELAARSADLDRSASVSAELATAREQIQRTANERDEAFERLRDAEQRLADARRQLDVVHTNLREKEEAVNRLRSELSNMNIQLEETSRGLTLTIVDQLLFNPGSADLNPGGKTLMGRVANIIQRDFPNRELVVEGHTDNVPIRHSGWRSNWELGAGRALSVLHELVSNHGFDPTRLSATTYGEFRPASPNATNEGRSANRRSVIVILPEKTSIQANQMAGL